MFWLANISRSIIVLSSWYWARNGLEVQWWTQDAGGRPFPVEYWELFSIIGITLVISYVSLYSSPPFFIMLMLGTRTLKQHTVCTHAGIDQLDRADYHPIDYEVPAGRFHSGGQAQVLHVPPVCGR